MSFELSSLKKFACALGAMIIAVAGVAAIPFADHEAYAATPAGTVRIHVLPYNNTDAIVVECDGRFGMVDSGEDNSYPDGSDDRYPLREGVTRGQGIERAVIAYMKSIGVNQTNLDFYIGTHPHSDHIGSASDIIREFHPKTVYTPYYSDALITQSTRLWDNRYVYDRLCEAVQSYDGRLVQFLDPHWKEPEEGDEAPEPDDADDADDADMPAEGDSEVDIRAEHTGSPHLELGSAVVEILNYDDASTDYLTYRVPDANFFSYGVKVTAPNGRIAFLAGDINDYGSDWSLGHGDETKLARTLRNVDFLKLGHHGLAGSNTPSYLRAILRPVSKGVRPVAVQTGFYQDMPLDTIRALHQLGVRHFNASLAAERGAKALVATLGDGGVTTNVDGARWIQQKRTSAPWAFFYSNGIPLLTQAGWRNIDGTWYFFDADSSVAMGWRNDGNHWYYLDWPNGIMHTGWLHEGSNHYFMNADGSMYVGAGWVRIGPSWYYYADQSGAVKTGWLLDGASWYFLRPESGAMATGWVKVDGSWYYLNGSGAMRTGWLNLSGTWYYLDGSGAMATGWRWVDGTWYYFDPSSGAMRTGWAKVDGAWYYLSSSGAMQTGWLNLGGTWYYLNGSGAMITGWGLVGGTWYYFDESGSMATGWRLVDDTWYYLENSGAMATGWQRIGGVWYYLRDSGAMASDCWVGNYYVTESGAMATSTWIGRYHVNESGLWDQTR